MKNIPLFDAAETERVAALVGFDPRHPGLAQDCLLDTQRNWSLPGELSDDERFQSHLYLAVGLFIFLKYENEDCNDEMPDSVRDWYQTNTALASADTLLIAVGAA